MPLLYCRDRVSGDGFFRPNQVGSGSSRSAEAAQLRKAAEPGFSCPAFRSKKKSTNETVSYFSRVPPKLMLKNLLHISFCPALLFFILFLLVLVFLGFPFVSSVFACSFIGVFNWFLLRYGSYILVFYFLGI